MKNILNKLIINRKITIFFVLVLIAFGIYSYISLPKQETPEFSIPYAMITTVFPGASQTDVDLLVTGPIEETVMSIEGYESSFSFSSNSLSLVFVELDFSADRDVAFSQLKSGLRELQATLPEGCKNIDINTSITETAGVIISLSSNDARSGELTVQAEKMTKELSGIEGFSRFEIIGKKEERITINPEMGKVMAAGLTLSDISNLVSLGNMDIPVGDVRQDGEKTAIDYVGRYRSIEDIENLIVGSVPESKVPIRLSDIAEITKSENHSATRYFYNGRETILIAGYFENDINILPLDKEINEKIKGIGNELPEGMETAIIISQPEEISESLGSFSINLLIAVGLVIMVVLVGMGFRNALVVSVSIPFSILITFLAMNALDIRIHQISIATLIMSLGMLVDNSIVVSDSIQGELDSGRKRRKACVSGTRDVAVPVLASTITTIAAFAPFLFLDSIAGDYIKSLPKIISISLVASYVTAVFIIPVLGYILFKKRKRKAKTSGHFSWFPLMLGWSMKRKPVVLLTVFILVAAGVFVALDLDRQFFPASDKDIVYIDVRNNQSDDMDGTADIMAGIARFIENEPEITEYTYSVGGGLPRFNQIMNIYTNTPDIGQMMIRTDLGEGIHDTTGELSEYLQQRLDTLGLDAKVTVKQLMYAFPMDEDIRIRVKGEELSNIKNMELKIYDAVVNTEGTSNVNRGNTDYTEVIEMGINEEGALASYLIPAEVLNEISIAVMGRESTVLISEGRETPVTVTAGIETEEDLAGYMVRTGTGQYVSAGNLMDLTSGQYLETIPRYDGGYSMMVTADFKEGFDKTEVLDEIKDSIDRLDIEDAFVTYDGEDELIKENFGQVFFMGAIALVIVFMILLVQFRSFVIPLLIFITIPMSAVGSVAGLYITGQPVSFTALLGIVSLLGIVVNNAIILIDYIQKDMKTNNAETACMNAANRRLRPILLSTITTVIGLIPLVIGTSQLFKPMAIALMSGLLVSTLLTLVVIPVAASVLLKGKNL